MEYTCVPPYLKWGIKNYTARLHHFHIPGFQIADFGLSNLYHKDKLLQTFCGSPLYASPEIVNGRPYHGPEVRLSELHEPISASDTNLSCLCVKSILFYIAFIIIVSLGGFETSGYLTFHHFLIMIVIITIK